MGEQLLKISHLSKSFGGIQALKDVSLDIDEAQIHCFAGINGSGKSTLIKCVSGVYQPDEGNICIRGREFSSLMPQQAIAEGIQVIYQDLSLFKHLTIAENIAINRIMNQKSGLVHQRDIYRIAQEQMEKINVKLDLSATIQESTMATCQLTAICRALAMDARIIFMDEPTTALTQHEVRNLMSIVNKLKQKGYAIVFISHKLDEVFDIADKISVFRDGEIVGNFSRNELDPKKLAQYMTGRDIEYSRYKRTCTNTDKVLKISHLSQTDHYTDISLDIRPGDIVGLSGLLGSGRTELALTLFGLNGFTHGEIEFLGKKIKRVTPSLMRKLGLGLLPEDRASQGLFVERSIRENLSAVTLEDCCKRRGIMDRGKEQTLAEKLVETMRIKTDSIEATTSMLSGGNQQKVAIGKWIASQPKLFIMDSPTVGIDVGSKAEMYERIQEYASNGMAILLISDEVEELVLNCNRIFVLAQGKLISVIDEEEREATPPEQLEAKISHLISIGNTNHGTQEARPHENA